MEKITKDELPEELGVQELSDEELEKVSGGIVGTKCRIFSAFHIPNSAFSGTILPLSA